MAIKIENSKTTMQTTAFFKNGVVKTQDCVLGDPCGEFMTDTCVEVSFDEEIKKINLPDGEYKITITLEKV